MAKYAGSAWNNEHNLVFINAMGDFLSHRTVYDCFKRIVKTIGMEDMRFHAQIDFSAETAYTVCTA